MKRNRSRRAIEMTVVSRRQTAPEQRRFDAALGLLLTEMVRQEISKREKGHHGKEESTR